MKSLVIYFSASGATAQAAEALVETIRADLFEIRPERLYTNADLNWKNPLARCNKEKIGIFATSGGSGIGKTAAKLQPYVEGADIIDAGVNLSLDLDALRAWADKIIASSMENLGRRPPRG